MRGRGEGKRAAWEGKEEARGRGGERLETRLQGVRVGRRRLEKRIGEVHKDPSVRSLSSPILLLNSFPPCLPSLFSPGLEPQTLRHSFSCWLERRSNCKTFCRTSPRGETWAAHVCDPCVSVPGTKNVTLELIGASTSRDLGQKQTTGCPRRPTSFPPAGLLAGSKEQNGNFMKTIQLLSIMQQVRWQRRALDRESGFWRAADTYL